HRAASRIPQRTRGRLHHRPAHCCRRRVHHHSRMALGALVARLASARLRAQPPIEFTCPMDPEVRSAQPGKCPKCGMKLEAGIREQVEYPLSLRVTPKQIPAGRELQLTFRVTDPKTRKPVKQFEVVHEKLFHLFIVSHDLEYFAHVHPELQADG